MGGLIILLGWGASSAFGQTFSRGPFRLNIGAILGATWTDNANASEDDPASEFSIFTGPTISGDITLAPRIAGGQPLTVSLSMAYTVSYSFGDEVEDRFDAPIAVSVVLPIYFYGWDVVLSDSFRFSNDPLEKTFAFNRDEVPEYNNTAQISIGRRFGRLGINLTGSRSDRWLPDDPEQEETTYTVSLTPSYFLREGYAVFTSGSLFWTLRPDPLRSDVEGYSVAVGVTGQITQNLSGSASVGYSHLTLVDRRQLNPSPPPTYLPLGDDNVDGITSTIALNYSNPLRPNTTYSIAFSRSPGITAALENSDITEATSVTLAIAHQLSRHLTLAPVVSWIYLEDVSDIGDGEKTHIVQVRTGLSRQFGRKLRGDLTHTFQTRNSNLAGQSYDVNTVTVTLSYQF
ncbi:MAG: outer membrane beta-barrel protein [Verrucomicrobiae bacterium]|nr:outer membrane beta-barrel protein [Verrucomicrobiae bacterium]MDW8344736.1 outer membrane beta-barrel protein [Verrucomicrobiae bacterium]